MDIDKVLADIVNSIKYSVRYDYGRRSCGRPDCSHEYSRCYEIVNIKFDYFDFIRFARDIVKSKNKIDLHCLERILSKQTEDDFDAYGVSGYYGEELCVKWKNQDKITRDVRDILTLESDREKIEAVLIYEYGYLLNNIKESHDFEIKKINISDIKIPNEAYSKRVNNKIVDKYEEQSNSFLILYNNGLVDGYHRYAAGLKFKRKKIDVINFLPSFKHS